MQNDRAQFFVKKKLCTFVWGTIERGYGRDNLHFSGNGFWFDSEILGLNSYLIVYSENDVQMHGNSKKF